MPETTRLPLVPATFRLVPPVAAPMAIAPLRGPPLPACWTIPMVPSTMLLDSAVSAVSSAVPTV